MIKGITIEFEHNPTQATIPHQRKFNENIKTKIDYEIESLRNRGVILFCEPTEGQFISNIFPRVKKNGTIRIILDLSELTPHIQYYHFKMDTIQTATSMITKNCFMSSVDLRDAYYSVNVNTEYRKYLTFIWDGKLMHYARMPNGLSSAPRDFTKLLKPVYAYLRLQGVNIMGYIDDTFIVHSDKDTCSKHIDMTVSLLERLGFTVNKLKSVLEPVQVIEHLGFIIDSRNMEVRISDAKKEDIISLAKRIWRNKDKVRIREVATFVGKIIACEPGVNCCFLHYRAIEMEKIDALRQASGNFDAFMKLSNEACTDVVWWLNNINKAKRSLCKGEITHNYFSDSSSLGWGAWTEDKSTQGIWSVEEQAIHINVLELKAAFLGLQALCANVTNAHIRMHIDNATAVVYINKFGGVHSTKCNEIAKKIWAWAEDKNNWLTATFIPSRENDKADKLSRNCTSGSEWELCNETFLELTKIIGEPEVDLFASRINHKTNKYVSWKPDRQAIFIDAFTLKWDNNFYAFPPFSLLGKVINKVVEDRVWGVVIAPFWPTQVWFPRLLELSTSPPLLLPRSPLLLRHPTIPGPHPLHKKLKLMAWTVSGTCSGNMTYPQGFRILFGSLGGRTPKNSTRCISKNGENSVKEGNVTPFCQL